MAFSLLRVVLSIKTSAELGFADSDRYAGRVLSSKFVGKNSRKKVRWSFCSLHDNPKQHGKLPVLSSLVANTAGEAVMYSEQKVYDVVLRQAALVKDHKMSEIVVGVKPDMVIPGATYSLKEAYDQCREVCAENSKTFYLGELL